MERNMNTNLHGNMNGGMDNMNGGSTDNQVNYNLHELEEMIQDALDNYDRVYRRSESVKDEIIRFAKEEFGAKKVHGIRVTDLTRDEQGMPKELRFNIIYAGDVIEKLRNSKVTFNSFGQLNISFKINSYSAGAQQANNGFAKRGAGFTNRGSQMQAPSESNTKKYKVIKIALGLSIAVNVIAVGAAWGGINSALEYKAIAKNTKQILKNYNMKIVETDEGEKIVKIDPNK